MAKVTFYHSAICPRCRLASAALESLADEYPDVRVERVEYLTNFRAARSAGVLTIPTLRSNGRALSGFFLTKSNIRRFLDSLGEANGGGVALEEMPAACQIPAAPLPHRDAANAGRSSRHG
jgi:glutaredoxin